ncbi:MAG: cytochrome c biogenesis protein CcsA [Tolumonas sp.]
MQNVPPLLSIEKQLIRLLKIGSVLLTLSISSGFLFLDNMLAPGNLDKAGVSVVAWCLYAILLWGHYRRGWRGQRLVVMTLTGNVLLAIAYFGSRLLQHLL